MKQKTHKTGLWTKKSILIIVASVLVAALVVTGGYFAHKRISYYNSSADQANIVSIRELILLAMRGLKKDAPVDPRTGDVYFPESKLYLPNPGFTLPLTYVQDVGDITDAQSGLSISTYPIRGTGALYSARNSEELFAAVPKTQACGRGIKLVYAQFPDSDTQNVLKHIVKLGSGRTLYVYLEKDCPELDGIVDVFKNIRSY